EMHIGFRLGFAVSDVITGLPTRQENKDTRWADGFLKLLLEGGDNLVEFHQIGQGAGESLQLFLVIAARPKINLIDSALQVRSNRQEQDGDDENGEGDEEGVVGAQLQRGTGDQTRAEHQQEITQHKAD